jgi:TolB-like protein/Tfp pilus assembly protein PilF
VNPGAVFLSYASQDAAAAVRICEALRAAGVEVWLDQSELRGGEAWDAQIKKQIHDCALFVPLISAHTNARTEGYFRREWNLAARRLLDMAQDAAFLVPVVIDGTREADARVPEEFLRAHWTRLPGGETPPAFSRRVRQLLGADDTAAHAAHEAIATTPEPGVARRAVSARSWRVGVGLIALLMVLGGGFYWRYQGAGKSPSAPPADEDRRPSIAVLPLENRSRLDEDAFFVDGIHDDILTQLSKVSGLKVISRTSAERFRGTDLSVKEIAAQLGVTSILEGGVQRAGDHVRINVQLIDAGTDAHLWAEIYDRELTAATIFDIQSEVAAAIANALDTTLTPAEKAQVNSTPTESLPAWEAYQLGRQRLARRTTVDLIESEKYFRKAIELDPGFALAHAGLADSLTIQISYNVVPMLTTLPQVEAAAREALRLDENLSEGWTALAGVAEYREEFARAEQLYRRAIELNPNNVLAWQWLGQLLPVSFRFDEARRSLEKALNLDPLSATIRMNLAVPLELQGRFPEAAAEYRRAIEIDPSVPSPHQWLAELNAYAFNRFAAAVPLLRKAEELDSKNSRFPTVRAWIYLDLRDESQAFSTIDQAAKRWPGNFDIQVLLAVVERLRLDPAGAALHAERALALQPRDRDALAVLRDLDLQHGRYEPAIARYRKSHPELFEPGTPLLHLLNYRVALDLALVLQRRGDTARIEVLLDSVARAVEKLPRLGPAGYGLSDVQIHALRGDEAKALAALREASQAGWRLRWRYHESLDPALASIRSEPAFKAAFADIERDMARQRAELAAQGAH